MTPTRNTRLRAALRARAFSIWGEVLCASCSTVCERPGGIRIRPWFADHVKPLADGGKDELVNLQPLCWTCHDRKTNREGRRRSHRPRPMAKAYR